MSGIISGLLAMFGWGTSDFFVTKSTRKIGAILTFFWTQLISFIIALIFFIFKFKDLYTVEIARVIPQIIIAAFLFVIGSIYFFTGLEKGFASLVCPLMASWAMISVILGIAIFHDILKLNQIISIILIIIGIALISTDIKELLKKKAAFSAGAKEGIISMLCYGFAVFFLTSAIKTSNWFLPGFLSRLFMIIFIVLFAIVIKKQSLKIEFQRIIWLPLITIGIFDIIAFFAFSFGVSIEYSSIVAPIAASSPLVTIILAQIFLKEKLLLNQIVGIIMTLSGLVLISIK